MSVSIACIVVPDLPLVAVYRIHPQLGTKPVVVCDGDDSGAPVLCVSGHASFLGVRRAMSRSQAQAMSPEVIALSFERQWVRSALDALRDVALSFSPRVDEVKQISVAGSVYGCVCLDARGLHGLHGDEKSLGRAMVRSARGLGLDARVGLAGGVRVARLAALIASEKEAVRTVPKATERQFLAPLPVGLLGLPGRVERTLESFGIQTIGKLAALPKRGLKLRLGQEGMRAWRFSRGELDEPFVPERQAESFVESVDAGWAMGRMEPVLAELEKIFARLAHRLSSRGFVARALVLSFELESGDRWEHEVEPASPSVDVEVWLDAARLILEAQPPESPVERLELRGIVVLSSQTQGDLFTRSGLASSRKLDEVLARLGSMAVEGGLGSPRLLDTHDPDPVRVMPVGQGGAQISVPPASAVAMRRFRPPIPAEVIFDHGRPVRLNSPVMGGRIYRSAGPFSLRWGWWQEQPAQRDYYDVELDNGRLCRLFLDLAASAWFVDGILG